MLDKLKQPIPFKWKVQAAKKYGVTCVGYIDARQVMDLLDEAVGPANWQDKYMEVSGNVYCTLSIRVDGEWVGKTDAGSASAFESEKGQASDAFKRAAVKWGIGRFLYAMKPVKLDAVQDGTDDRGKPRYLPVDKQGNILKPWAITEYINNSRGSGQNKYTPRKKVETPAPAKAEVIIEKPSNEKMYVPRKKPVGLATDSDKRYLLSIFQKLGWDKVAMKRFFDSVEVSFKEMTTQQFRRCKKHLEKELQEKGGREKCL